MVIDTLVQQLERDMKRTDRRVFRPDEIPGLVRSAADTVFKQQKAREFPIKPTICTNAIAGERLQRGVRMPTGDRAMDRMSGAGRSDLSA